jgi:von Willebrand factor type A domain
MGGMTFLTPLDALFALAVALPIGALLASERTSDRIRRVLSLPHPRKRTVVPVAVALVLLTSLVAVAAAQPVVVRERLVNERADAQAFFVIDTSLSMRASAGPGRPTRLARAKQLALRLRAALPDVPIGIASMTDRTLPNLMPTTDPALFARTLAQSVGVDRPPPSQAYHLKRATSFQALVPLVEANVFSTGVDRRLLVVFTDGEASQTSPYLNVTLHRRVTPLLVHIWRDGEQIYHDGHADPHYASDPGSMRALQQLASIIGGHAYSENQSTTIKRAMRATVGFGGTRAHIDAYARLALAPWFILAGAVPLAFLLWRRNA